MNNKSHILAATFANFILPIIVIAGCYYFIVHAVFKHEEELRAQAKKMNVASLRSNTDQQQVSAEIRIAKVSIMNVSMWLTAWTPFAVICILGTWGDVSKITPLVSAIPVILAKTSCAYNPLIYAISHPKYREVTYFVFKINEILITNLSNGNLIYLQCLKQMYPWMCIVEEKKSVADNQSAITEKTEMTETVKCESA
jgi:r-opsin